MATRTGPRAPVDVESVQTPSWEPPFILAEWKFRPPAARPGIVARSALLDLVLAASQPPVIAVVAPAGYGKTTFLAQWAEHRKSPVAWVSVDARDNDPVVLLTYLAVALDRIEAIDPRVFRALGSSAASLEVPRSLVASMATMQRTDALVIDNLEVVTNPESLDAVAALALGLPIGWQLVIGSRVTLPLPVARLRAQGGIAEVGIGDLAMDSGEAGPFLLEAGVELGDEDLDELVRRTEGWPVGLYLAALALNHGGSTVADGAAVSGNDRYVGDYLRSEILDRVSAADGSFLTHTSVLDRMCGPLCDAVVGISGSAAVLERLERSNLLVVPLDHRREWYRYHQLFSELLVSELRRRDPEVVPELHRRAAAWYEANGFPEPAIRHAQRAGDADTVARLVLEICNAVWASGRTDTVRSWMEWFEANDLIEHYPGIAVTGALQFAVDGRTAAAERWADAAERSSTTGVLSDGSTVEGMLSFLRANLCRDGVDAMRRDAQDALRGLGPGSSFRSNMIQVEGLSHLLEGDAERADRFFARAVDEATRVSVQPTVALALADRGSAAIEQDDWAAAGTFADQALSIMHEGQFDDYWTSGLVYAWTARVAAQRGDLDQARQLVARAARLRPLLTYALPVESARALLEMARAYLALADPGGARAVVRQANDIFRERPALGHLPQQADELSAQLDATSVVLAGGSSLTAAELRLAPLLGTHLTLQEIGDRLYIARSTVKSQAISIYRKLGVTSRHEAVDKLHELGLLVM